MPIRSDLFGFGLVLALTSLSSVTALAQSSRVDGVRIAERGIYEAEAGALNPATGVRPIRSARLLQATTSIPARLGLRFGMRYALHGIPIAAFVPVEIVTRYPPQGIQLGSTPPVTEHRHTVRIGIGVPQYCDYQFDEPEELVAGIWTIEIWHAGRKLGGQRFCVSGAEPSRAMRDCRDETS